MSGYTKLFSTIVSSSVWAEPDAVRLVWVTMLALADRDGIVESSVPGLSHLARVDMAKTEDALRRLEAPDPYSRTTSSEGRRIERVPGGWRLINYVEYRERMNLESRKEYKALKQREYRERDAAKLQGSTPVHGMSTESTGGQNGHTADSDSDSDSSTQTQSGGEPGKPASPLPVGCKIMMEFPLGQNDPKTKQPLTWGLTEAKLAEYRSTFPSVDVEAEARKAAQWLVDNPSRRKTAKGMPKFLFGWFERKLNRGGGSNGSRPIVKSPFALTDQEQLPL